MNFLNQLLENSKDSKSILRLKKYLGADLADMQLISKYNKGISFLLCVIDFFSKCPEVVSLKDKKGTTIVNAFKLILNNSERKRNKIWVDQGNELFNKSFKKWLEDNNIEMY